MEIMVIGASQGLGRALVTALANDGHQLTGVSRSAPADLLATTASIRWICADFAQPQQAVAQVAAAAPAQLDAIIYNLGIWEAQAFSTDYDFAMDEATEIIQLLQVNLSATILLLQRLLPKLLCSSKPQIILTGSTSGLRQSGRPEVTFSACKHALNGIADALREGYRQQQLAVTCLQLGYLNTEDQLHIPLSEAVARGQGELIPLHDVVAVVRTVLSLSNASFIREITLPALLDPRF